MDRAIGMSPARSEPYETITVDKLTPIIGAEIAGVDLGKLVVGRPLQPPAGRDPSRAGRESRDLLPRPGTSRRSSTWRSAGCSATCIFIRPRRTSRASPELMIIHADKDSPRANGEGWHTDVSCDVEPPMGSILYIKKCPPRGGDTLFASMYAAYDALSDRMKAYLEGMTAIHDGEPVYRGLYQPRRRRQAGISARRASGGAHPSGDGQEGALRQPRLHAPMVGVPRDESDAMLRYLYQHMENPLFQCRFRWRENSIAFWDNRCAQHRAMWDYWPHTRAGTRVTVKGERPV